MRVLRYVMLNPVAAGGCTGGRLALNSFRYTAGMDSAHS